MLQSPGAASNRDLSKYPKWRPLFLVVNYVKYIPIPYIDTGIKTVSKNIS